MRGEDVPISSKGFYASAMRQEGIDIGRRSVDCSEALEDHIDTLFMIAQ